MSSRLLTNLDFSCNYPDNQELTDVNDRTGITEKIYWYQFLNTNAEDQNSVKYETSKIQGKLLDIMVSVITENSNDEDSLLLQDKNF